LGELASPQGVREVVHHRLSTLSRPTSEMIELAAVVGATFEFRVMDQALQEDTLAASLEEALASGTIQELPGPGLSYRFSHELVRRALYDRLSSLRRAQLHLRVGEALDRVADAERVLPELAHHFAVAAPLGGAGRAVQYNLRAAEAALALLAFAQAEGFATAALELTTKGEPDWARAQYLLATAEYMLGRWDVGSRAAAAASTFVACGDLEAATEAEMLATRGFRDRGRGDEAEAASERALALARDLPRSRLKATALIFRGSSLFTVHAHFRESAEHLRQGLALADELGLVSLQVNALAVLGAVLSALGADGVPELERAIALGRGGVDPHNTLVASNHLAQEMFHRGRVRDVAEICAKARAEVEPFGIHIDLQMIAAQESTAAYHLGDWRRAQELIEQYDDLLRETRGHRYHSMILEVQANIARARGDHTAALADAEQARASARRVRYYQRVGGTAATLAVNYVDAGRLDEAKMLVDELLLMTDEEGASLHWRWMLDLGWLLHDLGRSEAPPFCPRPVWNDPAQAIARGDIVGAAELLAATELVAEGAYAHLRAGERLAAEGRQARAQAHAERGAAFYRRVDATAFLERAEALLPAPTSGRR
jgi:tetratricopeptide (TPR) repeat protein